MTVNAVTLLSEALGIPADSVGADTKLGLIPEWDSLAHMRLVLGIEEKLGRQLAPEEVLSIDGLDAVEALFA